MNKYAKSTIRKFARSFRQAGEMIVQNGLAVTPSQMLEMAQAGIPISSVNADFMYRDGDRKPPESPTMDMLRGVDIGDLWENMMETRRKMRKLRDTPSSEPAEPNT